MSEILQQVLETKNILYLVLFVFTMRIVYASNHFYGESRDVLSSLRSLAIVFSIMLWAYPIITAIKVSVLLGIVLLIGGLVISYIISAIRNAIISAVIGGNSNPFFNWDFKDSVAKYCTVVSKFGIIIGIPIIVYLVL